MHSNEYRDEITGMVFVRVKGGTFMMGDNFGDGFPDEIPVHEVSLEDYYIGKYAVTRGQWEQVLQVQLPPDDYKTGRHPIEFVSWLTANEFIKRLNVLTKKNYRLPTEAEWEYAARNRGEKEKWAGTSDPDEVFNYAWFDANSGNKLQPVGTKRPNGLGIYDMSGNTHEWVQDLYDREAYQKYVRNESIEVHPDAFRVFRGGSYHRPVDGMRCSRRFGASPRNGDGHFGVRLAFSVS